MKMLQPFAPYRCPCSGADRLGTNWPHNSVRETAAYPDDARLAELTLGWLPDDAARHRALVENPEALFKLPPLKAV